MFDFLFHLLADPPQAYLIVFAVAAGDAVLPALPSESLLILGGVFAAHDRLDLEPLIVAGALGAFVGDNASYWVGRTGGGWVRRRLEGRESFRRRFDWACDRLNAGGGYIVPVARFIPGGRTAVTFSAGALRLSMLRFVLLVLIGAASWSVFASLVGYFGGRAFERSEWKALLLAFGIALTVTAVIEGGRRLWNRR